MPRYARPRAGSADPGELLAEREVDDPLAPTWWSDLNDQVTAAVVLAASHAAAHWAAPAESSLAA